MGVVIDIVNLSKSFGNVKAVNRVSFSVSRGEVVGLLGPNGAGKTTTLRMLTGFLTPNEGRVTIDGQDISEAPIASRAKIGYLPERCPLYDDMEVIEFLRYIGKLRSIPKTDINRHIKEMVTGCGLEDVVGRPIGQLSKGYRQRVGLAQALIHHPKILVLDEPTSGLDPNQIVEIRNLIKKIGREKTVILSTHILQEVEATCSKAFIINRGELAGAGTLKELMERRTGGDKYHVNIKASKDDIAERLPALSNATLISFSGHGDDKWQGVVLRGINGEDASEEIFKWVLGNGWTLKELRRETATLEEIFHELTTEQP